MTARFRIVSSLPVAVALAVASSLSAQNVVNEDTFTDIAHYFYEGDPIYDPPTVYDYLSADPSDADSGVFLSFPTFTIDAPTGGAGSLSVTLRAPEGMQFVINPSGYGDAASGLYVMLQFGAFPGPHASVAVGNHQLTFGNLNGTPGEVITYSGMPEAGGFLSMGFTLRVPASISFTSLTYSIDYSGATFDAAQALPWASGYVEYQEGMGALGHDPGPLFVLAPIPEPAAFALFAGLAGLAWVGARRRIRKVAAAENTPVA